MGNGGTRAPTSKFPLLILVMEVARWLDVLDIELELGLEGAKHRG